MGSEENAYFVRHRFSVVQTATQKKNDLPSPPSIGAGDSNFNFGSTIISRSNDLSQPPRFESRRFYLFVKINVNTHRKTVGVDLDLYAIQTVVGRFLYR